MPNWSKWKWPHRPKVKSQNKNRDVQSKWRASNKDYWDRNHQINSSAVDANHFNNRQVKSQNESIRQAPTRLYNTRSIQNSNDTRRKATIAYIMNHVCNVTIHTSNHLQRNDHLYTQAHPAMCESLMITEQQRKTNKANHQTLNLPSCNNHALKIATGNRRYSR